MTIEKWPISCSRYYALLQKCSKALDYAERRKRNGKFKYDMENETYLAAEERYDYSCEHLRKSIEASGLNLPKKYKGYRGKYLQWECNVSIGYHFKELKTIHFNRKEIKKRQKFYYRTGMLLIDQFLVNQYQTQSKRSFYLYM